ncbi:dihydrofolate reductase family protein [Cellulosimicrobium cellulans]|uniref:dihydrofolate reductase family protein n=1 Tax=Cellulosimicrobium cellulans TaxID=1710 RepID=UPI00196548C6|nr:dihydrofolate reductase family protein [Cellulosimicrobium cellulans]MBN0040579.1 dihydrofolate reductase family protein [Cellulosimicrobium cellulans]
MTRSTGRLVTANLALTLDGRYHGPGGPGDFGAFAPYVATDTARDQMTRMCAAATTAVLGRVNAEGFLGYWPPVADDDTADPRDRAYARWLVDTEKVVLSTSLAEAPWDRARVVDGPAADVVAELRGTGEGDILVNSSASVIKALLAADLVDRLYLLLVPVVVGGGPRLFDDGLPATAWTVAYQETGATGELALVYDRAR